MYNDKRKISASEINKFIYCPYQWYYERFYGSKELRRLYLQRNKQLGLTDTLTANFNKGSRFHKNFGRFETFKRIAFALIIVLIISIIIYLCYGKL